MEFWGLAHVRSKQSRWIFPRVSWVINAGAFAYLDGTRHIVLRDVLGTWHVCPSRGHPQVHHLGLEDSISGTMMISSD